MNKNARLRLIEEIYRTRNSVVEFEELAPNQSDIEEESNFLAIERNLQQSFEAETMQELLVNNF